MSKLDLSPGSQVVYRGSAFVISRVLDFDSVLAKEINTGHTQQLAVREIRPASDLDGEKAPTSVDLDEIPDADWKEANRRYEVIRPLLSDGRRTREEVQSQAELARVHWTTVYAWIRKFERTERISSLLPPKPNGGRGKPRIDPEVEQILQEVIERVFLRTQRATPQKTIEEVERLCRNSGVTPPHPNTVRNRIAVLSAEKKLARRYGARAAEQKYELHRGEFPGADWPLAIVEADHTKVDIMLVDDVDRLPIGRPWLTLIIDVFSRMVLGFYVSLDPPGAIGTGLALVHAILPKEEWLAKRGIDAHWPCWGIMDVLHADNAKEFESKMLERACEDYHIGLEYRRLAHPEDGGHIERLTGTFAKEIHIIPGTTFSNTAQRGDYDSEAKAVMTLREFEIWFATLITGVYHQRKHKALGTSPLKRYEEGILGTKHKPGRGLPPREMDVDRLRLAFTPYVERTIQPYGVLIDGITYSAPVLRKYVNAPDPEHHHRKRKFRFRRDPRDVSTIYFFDPDLQMYFPVPYRDITLPPISLWELRAAIRHAKEMGAKDIDEKVIFAARDRLHELLLQSSRKTKQARREAQRRREHQAADRPLQAPPRDSSSRSPDAIDLADDLWPSEEITPFDEMVEREDNRCA